MPTKLIDIDRSWWLTAKQLHDRKLTWNLKILDEILLRKV